MRFKSTMRDLDWVNRGEKRFENESTWKSFVMVARLGWGLGVGRRA